MGVHGLWRLIEPSGHPVPLETLENKVLAVDVSIWLHHFVKGFQDSRGAPVPNAHLLGIYHRLCKLLYFRIKPVFVFDGGVPSLKKQTIALRNQQKSKTLSEADRIHKNLLSALVKHSAISKVLSEKAKAAIAQSTSPSKKAQVESEDLYKLPALDSSLSESEDESSDPDDSKRSRRYDLHSIDTQSAEFKSLPVDVRHEILTDLKDTRKQSSWGRIHELPTKSDDFSGYQMKRLLKRQSVQTALEGAEKEMGGHSLSLAELEKLLKDQGVITNLKGSRIASDENTRFLLIKDIKQAVEDAKKLDLQAIDEEDENAGSTDSEAKIHKNKADVEFDDDLKKAIAMSLEDVPSTSKVQKVGGKGKNRMQLSFLDNLEDADFDESESSEEETILPRLTPAQRYMMEYSGLTPNEIAKIIASKRGVSSNVNGEQSKIQAANKSDIQEKIESVSAEVITDGIERETDVSVEIGETANETMSDSQSSSCEDFEDVEDKTEALEVVIKPDEDIEDDLFKDVFDQDDKSEASKLDVSTSQEKVIKEISCIEEESDKPSSVTTNDNFILSSAAAKDGSEIETEIEETTPKPASPAMMNKIKQMIKDYSDEKTTEDSSDLSVERLNQMRENLRQEQEELVAERSAKERHAGSITDQMYQEAQELLELFGVPYLVAPMEAEAQCAFLELIDLTDGTITDDSDIWLFGGRTVYKNFFNQSKVVLEFKSENIQHHYKLTREQMVLLAMLVGSDYTTGLSGVGPVTALEILAAFPPKPQILISGLAEFRSWFMNGKLPAPGRTSLRTKLKNLHITDHFPNPKIVEAYLDPRVETSNEKFTWGKPDVPGLVEFARQKFGWAQIKAEEILKPVLKRMEDRHAQKSITDYFRYDRKIDSGETENKMSKRVKTALSKIGKAANGEDEDEPKEKKTRTNNKSKATDGTKTKRARKKKTDEDIEVLKVTQVKSKQRVEAIQGEMEKEVEKQEKIQKKVDLQKLHKRETIPQKQKDKDVMLKNKLKAIETFRRSKQGPGFVKKGAKTKRTPKEDAGYLSEGSSSD